MWASIWARSPGPASMSICTSTSFPRWSGDTNFMPVIAGVGVVPDALLDIAAKLRAELAK